MQKIFILITLLAGSFLQVKAQNWKLFNPENTYSYKHSDSVKYVTHVIKVENIFQDQSNLDSLYDLNDVWKECNTCTRDGFLVGPKPQYFGYQIKALTEQSYQFLREKDTLNIRLDLPIDSSWNYKDTITAKVTSKHSATSFGNSDSTLTIELSSGDSIILSKAYGIIDFSDFDNGRYELTGIEELGLGDHPPTILQVFNLEIGDMFQYVYEYLVFKHAFDSKFIWTVKEKITDGSNTTYVFEKRHYGTYQIPIALAGTPFYEESTDTLMITEDSIFVPDFFNIDRMKFINTPGSFYKNESYDEKYSFPINEISPDGNKTIHFGYRSIDGLPINDSEYDVNIYLPDSLSLLLEVDTSLKHLFGLEFREGLGITQYHNFDPTNAQERVNIYMTGFVKDGVQVGDFDNNLGAKQSLNEQTELAIFPNPAQNEFIIKHNSPKESGVQISNSLGQVVYEKKFHQQTMINSSEWPKGMYFVSLINGDGNLQEVRKLILK